MKDMPSGAVAATVADFKACIIAARKWMNVEDVDITILGSWATDTDARAFASAPKIVSANAAIAKIELDPEAYVVARVASGLIPIRSASKLHRMLPPWLSPRVARLRLRMPRSC